MEPSKRKFNREISFGAKDADLLLKICNEQTAAKEKAAAKEQSAIANVLHRIYAEFLTNGRLPKGLLLPTSEVKLYDQLTAIRDKERLFIQGKFNSKSPIAQLTDELISKIFELHDKIHFMSIMNSKPSYELLKNVMLEEKNEKLLKNVVLEEQNEKESDYLLQKTKKPSFFSKNCSIQ
jgi:hypothetical protein